jgi:hypothetical protein
MVGSCSCIYPDPGESSTGLAHAEPANPTLVRMRQIAQVMSQARGWNTTLVAELDRALVVLLSGHADDQQLRYSQLVDVLHRYGVSITRVAEVLSLGGLLDDDRVPAFESWLKNKLADLAPDIAADVRAWIRALQHGGPRSHPRHPNTVRRYLRPIHPVLIEWSTRYQHLREVTTSDVTALAQSLHGHPRRHALGALGSLMRHGKKTGSIFADPTTRIRIGHRDDPVLVPLAPAQLDDTAQAATTPAARVALALAAVHAARPKAIRNLQLGDVDLGNRRLTIAGLTRPLDELTHHLLTDWLTYRRRRWPHTANPHLIINKQTASNTRPISNNALTAPFRRRAATLEPSAWTANSTKPSPTAPTPYTWPSSSDSTRPPPSDTAPPPANSSSPPPNNNTQVDHEPKDTNPQTGPNTLEFPAKTLQFG